MTHAKKAVVLAAGIGSRLGGDCLKPLIQVGDLPILCRTVHALADMGVRETVFVVGHRAEEIQATVGYQVRDMVVSYVVSDRYRSTNNAYSLWLARHHLTEDTWLIEGDVVFDAALLSELAAIDGPVITAVSPWRDGMEGTVVRLGPDGLVQDMLLPAQQGRDLDLSSTHKTVNIHLLRTDYLAEEFVPALDALVTGGGDNAYYELVIADSVRRGRSPVRGVDCRHLRWYEVDNATDLAAANYVFGTTDEQLDALWSMHGGYWRYDVVDHCLLYNLYFPPAKMIDELQREFGQALVHYPVGHATLQHLLGMTIRQPAERLVVANGASELIKILGRTLGRVALVVPGFNEYEAVFAEDDIHRIQLREPDFVLDVEVFKTEVRRGQVKAVIITSPNNPTSLAVARDDLLVLVRSLAEDGVLLVVDESFVDFCAAGQSLEAELAQYQNLVIVKSMSKVYGVGGLRLGYLLSANLELTARVRSELPIWNINGFAESFLRLLPRFQAEFRASCAKVRSDRDELASWLAGIDGLTVYPADANYVLVKLPDGVSAVAVTRTLFAEHRMLVKHCAGKSMPSGERYLRISCRTSEENERLVAALAAVLRGHPYRLPVAAATSTA